MAELLIAMGVMSPEIVAGTAGAGVGLGGPLFGAGAGAGAGGAGMMGSLLGAGEGVGGTGLFSALGPSAGGGLMTNPMMQSLLQGAATSAGAGLGGKLVNAVLPTAPAMPMTPGGGPVMGSPMMSPSARAAQLTQAFVLPHNQPQQGTTTSPEILAILAEALKRRQGG